MDQNGANPEKSPEDKTVTDRQKLVAALLFGLDHLDDPGDSQSTLGESIPRRRKTATDSDNSTDSISAKPSSIESILSFVDRHIPSNSAELRATPLYQTAHSAVRYQRDQYLIGSTYASWRSRRARPPRILPYDRTALGHQQFRPIAAQFIPTQTVIQALTPLIAHELFPVAFPVITDATVQIIESQQQNLDSVVQQSMLHFLQDPATRRQLKRSMIATYHDNNATSTDRSES